MSDAASIWHDAPCAALELRRDAGAVRWRLNRAAVEWSLEQGVAEADWRALADSLLAGEAPPPQGRVPLGAQWLQFRRVVLSSGWLLWLTPQGLPRAPHAGARHAAADKLALMQGFERVGFFERDARTGRGWWDRAMYRIAGVEPALEAPSVEQALRCVHPDDRDALRRFEQQAMRQAGRRATRYRLLLPDGRQRDLQ